MKILGIDPGLKATGYGLIDYEDSKIKLIEAGTIEPKQKDVISQKIFKIHKNLEDIILKHKPQVMVLEKLYTHYSHPVTACILGHVRGVICLLCAQHDIELVEQSVKRIRQTLTGTGAASKMQTQGMVAHMLRIKSDQLTADASDALALALGYTNLMGKSI